jgi:hypothetical protein
MSDDFEHQEYFTLVKAVDAFDHRLITIKGRIGYCGFLRNAPTAKAGCARNEASLLRQKPRVQGLQARYLQ